MKISDINIKGKAALAPMAGVTDRAFREICKEFGASLLTSEMVSAKGLIYDSEKTIDLIKHSNFEKPFSIQLFGSTPEDLAKATQLVQKYNPDIIDINMGCPAPKIVNNGSGSALMKNPKLCGEIVRAVVKESSVPVTVKIRAGWDENFTTAVDTAKYCEDGGAMAITVHGRTRKQMYSGKVDLEIIKKVKEAVKISVIGNGDVNSFEDAQNMINYTNCDMVAIGRGALGNPWIFKEINEWFDNNNIIEKPDLSEKVEIMKYHIKKMCDYKGENRGIKEARKHISWYLKGIKGAAELRSRAYNLNNMDEFEDMCRLIVNNDII